MDDHQQVKAHDTMHISVSSRCLGAVGLVHVHAYEQGAPWLEAALALAATA